MAINSSVVPLPGQKNPPTVMEVDNLEDALDEFDSRYLECYHQVTAKLACLAIGGSLLLSSPLLGPREDEDILRGLDLDSQNSGETYGQACGFRDVGVAGDGFINKKTNSKVSNSFTNSFTNSNISSINYNALYTIESLPIDDGLTSSMALSSSVALTPLTSSIARASSIGSSIGTSIPTATSESSYSTINLSRAASYRGSACSSYNCSDFTPAPMRRSFSMLKSLRADSSTNPLRHRLLLTLLITPKLVGRVERRNTVATYVGNPFYRGRGSPQRKLAGSGRLLGEEHCTFETGEVSLTGRGRPCEGRFIDEHS